MMDFREIAKRLQNAVDAADLSTAESILTGHELDGIRLEDMRDPSTKNIFAQATLWVLKNGKNVLLHQSAILNLNKYDIEDVISECSHKIGLEGLITLDHVKDGNTTQTEYCNLRGRFANDSIRALGESVKKYSAMNNEFSEIHDAFHYLLNTPIDQKQNIVQRHADGHLIISELNWLGHGLGMAFIFHPKTHKSYIILSNRGDKTLSVFLANTAAEQLLQEGSHRAGTIIYELERMLSAEFLRCFEKVYFAGPEQLKTTIKDFLAHAKPIIILPAGSQSHENCTYVNPKRVIEGILFVSLLLRGAPLNQQTMTAAYQSYKQFSFFDKEDSCLTLVNFQRNYRAQLKSCTDAIRAIDQLMVKIIIAHHDNKEENHEFTYLRKIFLALPRDLQEKLGKIVPNEMLQTTLTLSPSRLFSRQNKNLRKTRIIGANHDVLQHIDILSDIYKALQQFSRMDIPEIAVQDKYVFIHLKDPAKAYAIINLLRTSIPTENIGYIQEDIISVKATAHAEQAISDENIIQALIWSVGTGKDNDQLKADLHLTKEQAEALVSNANSTPLIRRSDNPEAMPNFLVLSFYGPLRRRVVHLQFECEQTNNKYPYIKNAAYLKEIYDRYNAHKVERKVVF